MRSGGYPRASTTILPQLPLDERRARSYRFGIVEVIEEPRAVKKSARREPTARQLAFARLVAKGTSNADAFRKVYNRNVTNQRAAEKGCRIAASETVSREIDRFRAKAEMKDLLSLNDRFRILARHAQNPDNPAGVQIAAILAYSKLGGDMAPERKEISGPGGGPIEIEQTGAPAGPVKQLSISARIALFDQRRQAEATQAPGHN